MTNNILLESGILILDVQIHCSKYRFQSLLDYTPFLKKLGVSSVIF